MSLAPVAPEERRAKPRFLLRLTVLNAAILLVGFRLGYLGSLADKPIARLWVMAGAVALVAVNSWLVWQQWRRAERDRVTAGVAAATTQSPDFEMVVGFRQAASLGVVVTGDVHRGRLQVGQSVTVLRRGRISGAAGVVAVETRADGTTALTLTGISHRNLLAGDLLLG